MQKPNESTANAKRYMFIFIRLKLGDETIVIDPDEAHTEVDLYFRYHGVAQVIVCLFDGTYKVITSLAEWIAFSR